MSRKKAVKAKGSSKSPKASPSSSGGSGRDSGRTGKGLAAAAAPSSGLVYPSRPSVSNSGEFYDIAFKVMLVGDSGVGKTCLLVRFKDGAFLAGSFISTVGIDFRNKVMTIDAVKVKLQIWDTAGQERFRSVTHAYYRDAHALLLLYDVTNKSSFDNIRGWLYTHQGVVLILCHVYYSKTRQLPCDFAALSCFVKVQLNSRPVISPLNSAPTVISQLFPATALARASLSFDEHRVEVKSPKCFLRLTHQGAVMAPRPSVGPEAFASV
ncbi:ras-related protein Rab-26-like [Solea senegalensis]|uniref:Ras-related protein Rab-26-like n=1 Tax=Solea senegalensis TaxID=28829 RepID=A0AAV6RRV1_SOLSE|nr:ras-related protein Rab-26-like [Solea senegalensis]